MTTVNMLEAKTKLSKLVEAVETGAACFWPKRRSRVCNS